MAARSKTPTKRGTTPPSTDEIPTEILGEDFARRAKAKTAKKPAEQIPSPPVLPAAPVIKAISMKTPGDVQKREMPESEMPHVKLRAMSEMSRAQTPQNLGNLAPPYDPSEARKRSVREYVVWGCIAIMIACAIALVVWFVAR
ncbi:MAG TPA: hypothetical protein VMZ53_28815 [Kofleriaceae bacterium]|nr:hypothetical protein [Kofleriaceae bacterium]